MSSIPSDCVSTRSDALGAVDWERRARCRTRPPGAPAMYHVWKQLAFLHWRYDPAEVQRLLPPQLTVDVFDGSAWVAIVPFEMHGIRPRWSVSVPHVSNFLELNLRTYAVDEQGAPGVWFISLSANRRLAVYLGRRWFGLPYHFSALSTLTDCDGWIDYQCLRRADPQRRTCRYRYRPTGSSAPAAARSLEFFLIERYFLFSVRRDQSLATGQVHHSPYEIQPLELEAWDDQLFAIDGLTPPARPPDHVCFARQAQVEVFGLRPPGAV